MNAETLRQILESTPERVLIVDVREREEVMEEPLLPIGTSGYVNVPLSVLQMLPRNEICVRLKELADEGKRDGAAVTLVFSCRSGGRSARAQVLCMEAGIIAENLEGGYLAWEENKRLEK